MKNDKLYDKIIRNEIGLITGLKCFGSDYSLEKLCSSIENKNETELSAFLLSVDECGAIDILTEACIIAEWTHDKELIDWFYNNCLRKCSMCDLSNTLKYKYLSYEKYLANEKFQFFATTNDFFSLSQYQFECFIWENLDKAYLKSLKRNSSQNIGIWFTGVFSESLTTEYLSSLEQYAFPVLIQTGTDIKESKIQNKTVIAITINNICLMLSELSRKLDFQLERIMDEYITEDINTIAKQDSGHFYALIQNYCSKYELGNFVQPTIVMQIEELLRISEYYGDLSNMTFAKCINYYLPLLYEINDRNSIAYDKLFDQIQTSIPYLKVHIAYLIALYRCLLVTNDIEKRKKLIAVFDNIFTSKSYIKEILKLMNDVALFYYSHADRMSNKDFCNLPYQMLSKNESLRMYVIENWFKTKRIYHAFEKIIQETKSMLEHESPTIDYGANPIERFITLLNGLTSHRDTDIRIGIKSTSRILEPELLNDDSFEFEKVYDIYTPEEQERLCDFIRRLQIIQEGLPSDKYINYYIKIRKNVDLYYKTDKELILCEKIISAIGEIQTNSYDINKEDFYNNQIALFLRGYYGEANVHREKPQGSSSSGTGQGETDILVYQEEHQFSLIESIRLSSFNKGDKNQLDDHLKRLIDNYDTRGTYVNCLLVFARTTEKIDWFSKIENYLDKYTFPSTYKKLGSIKRVDCKPKNICHHVVKYQRGRNDRSLHIFTALINPVVIL